MKKTLAGLTFALSFAIAGEGYQLNDLTKFLKGTDGTEKAIRYISVRKNYYRLEKAGTGKYDITQYGWKVAERQDINLNNLGELRKIKITDPWEFGTENYGKEFATIHLTREQKRAFRENPSGYIQQLNQYLTPYHYRADYKLVNQKNPRTGTIRQVPKIILVK